MDNIEEFIAAVRFQAAYWAKQKYVSEQERCDGLACSFLSLIDGVTESGLPPIDLVVDGETINSDCYLHDMYYEEKDA
jgi:hypothetical protein